MDLKSTIYEKISSGNLAFRTEVSLLSALRLKGGMYAAGKAALKELIAEGKISVTADGRYYDPKTAKIMTGTVQASAKGSYGFVVCEDVDLFISKNGMRGVYDGDEVRVAVTDEERREGCIIEILSRGIDRVIGCLYIDRGRWYVEPQNPRHPTVYIREEDRAGAEPGDIVVAKIVAYDPKSPRGEVTEVLGEDTLETEAEAIARAWNVSDAFSNEALAEAEKTCGQEVSTKGRKDLRKSLVFTIDGSDTRDMDDAVSLEVKKGRYVLGVHIADVTRYVERGSRLDGEAFEKGTSVYFPHKTYPMLPECLSNGMCSLNENEDRYALSCVMTFDSAGRMTNSKIFESVVRSRHKTSYDEIDRMLEGENVYPDLEETVLNMKELCLLLEKRRSEKGAVNLVTTEPDIKIEENGEIRVAALKESMSRRIIEQFMVSANEAVAEFLIRKKAPCAFRVHEKPSAEKAEDFMTTANRLGVPVGYDCENVAPKDFAKILEDNRESPRFDVLNDLMLRSMQKARYSEKNLGHFGLASEAYCHFTSPIRRYPDLFVHRCVKAALHKKDLSSLASEAAEVSRHSSEKEIDADGAERDCDDLFSCAYMRDKVGRKYSAKISGMTESGMFAKMKNTVEGFIPLTTIENAKFLPDCLCVVAGKARYEFGDEIEVKVASVDMGSRRIRFDLALPS